jgi:hypothetical protein
MGLDRNVIEVGGAEAIVKWGYHVAMRLGAWRFTGSGSGGGVVNARVVEHDEFRSGQSPLTLVLVMTGGDGVTAAVKWPVQALEVDGQTARVHVGPCERSA